MLGEKQKASTEETEKKGGGTAQCEDPWPITIDSLSGG